MSENDDFKTAAAGMTDAQLAVEMEREKAVKDELAWRRKNAAAINEGIVALASEKDESTAKWVASLRVEAMRRLRAKQAEEAARKDAAKAAAKAPKKAEDGTDPAPDRQPVPASEGQPQRPVPGALGGAGVRP